VATLVFIHGRGLKPPKDVERKSWLDAVNRGLTRLDPPPRQLVDDPQHVRLAYWSDLFYPPEATSNPAGVSSSNGIVDAAEAGLTEVQTQSILALVDRFWSWRLPQPATAAVADPQTKQFEDGFVRDVVKFFGLGYGDTCAGRLRDELIAVDSGDPVLLVSHSFGTVLAYEVLLNDIDAINAARAQNGRAALAIDTWVTMGSPLGWAIDLQAELPTWKERLLVQIDQGLQPTLQGARAVLQYIGDVVQLRFDRLLQSTQSPPSGPALPVTVDALPAKLFPSSIGRWFNIYDTRDPVACAAGVGVAWGGGLAVGQTFLYTDQSGQGQQRAFDVTIRNDDCPPSVVLPDIRAHDDFDGYGQCAQLGQIVADVWSRCGGQWA
jgi:hypothetical protein